ncbi:MAG TPA: hemerythrin domain-containing protein [Syntrophorhabdaceae bacterium]|nr:hemerythrin domain-containing protein [Syntrophorhabdaceae bacterium]
MKFKTPQPLKAEHEELHAELAKATKEKGKIGDAAKTVAEVLHPHFVKEEEYAMPPLGLLPIIARGKISMEMWEALMMTDKLKAELKQMLKEHKAIVGALKKLAAIAKKEKKMEYARFAEKLMLHAKTEEEVLYPASILVGEYLKLKLKK